MNDLIFGALWSWVSIVVGEQIGYSFTYACLRAYLNMMAKVKKQRIVREDLGNKEEISGVSNSEKLLN